MSNKYQCSEEAFLNEVATHQMTIIRDDEHGRHIKFKRPDTSSNWFQIITWSGVLCIEGDMGTYVFRRIEDMFEFFRTDRDYATRKGFKLAINPSYWEEKLQAKSTFRGSREFDEARFEEVIKERLKEWIRDHRDDTSREERRELYDAVNNEVLGADSDIQGMRKQIAANDFHHTVNTDLHFTFQDFWEHRLEKFTYQYIWCCYAIAWAVKQYDEAKEPKSSEAVALLESKGWICIPPEKAEA